jgi:hypothetical protein
LNQAKPFPITKRQVWEAYKRVKANQGGAGVDEQSLTEFDEDLENNRYKLWNRLASSSRTREEAEDLKAALARRFAECRLELPPEKAKIVYFEDDDGRLEYPCTRFGFLGYTFRPRRSKNRWGKDFINFSPAISNEAAKAIRQEVRGWRLQLRSDKDLDDPARIFNAVIRGWVNDYGVFFKSALYPTLQHIDRKLARWATRKFKRLRRHQRRAEHWLRRIAPRQPALFAHWRLLYGQAG